MKAVFRVRERLDWWFLTVGSALVLLTDYKAIPLEKRAPLRQTINARADNTIAEFVREQPQLAASDRGAESGSWLDSHFEPRYYGRHNKQHEQLCPNPSIE